MIIRSPFKDYYDYVGNVYGNDPSVTYIRNRIAPRSSSCPEVEGCLYIQNNREIVTIPYPDSNTPVGHFRWLVVCGKYFLLISTNDITRPYKIFTPEENPGWVKSFTSRYSYWRMKGILDNIGKQSQSLIDLSIDIKQPVFTIERNGYRGASSPEYIVNGDIPKLGELGLAKVYPAEQLYQDLEYFLMNTMKISPDTAIPSKMSDKEKIVQHGFDFVQSFRHR